MIKIEDMQDGAVLEAINNEIERAVDNVRDPNTEATTARVVTIKLTLKPDATRELVETRLEATSKLAALQKPIIGRIVVTHDDAEEWSNPQKELFDADISVEFGDDGKIIPMHERR